MSRIVNGVNGVGVKTISYPQFLRLGAVASIRLIYKRPELWLWCLHCKPQLLAYSTTMYCLEE